MYFHGCNRIIWLGDLNYRMALSYRSAKALVEMLNWRAFLQNDQLRIEKRRDRVFTGWNEWKIYFPPTYKYSNNSDRYAGDDRHAKEKRRYTFLPVRQTLISASVTTFQYISFSVCNSKSIFNNCKY